MKTFNMKYYFVSRKSNGADFFYTTEIIAKDAMAAYSMAKGVGFNLWGEMFNDNCIDWKIVN